MARDLRVGLNRSICHLSALKTFCVDVADFKPPRDASTVIDFLNGPQLTRLELFSGIDYHGVPARSHRPIASRALKSFAFKAGRDGPHDNKYMPLCFKSTCEGSPNIRRMNAEINQDTMPMVLSAISLLNNLQVVYGANFRTLDIGSWN